MRFPSTALVLTAFLLLSCADPGERADAQRDWQEVLARKEAAQASGATAREKQAYADALGAFVHKHPAHGRGRAVYQRVQLDFADELAALGRYRDAVRIYRSVLSHDPANATATAGLNAALERLAVTAEKMRAVEKGMSQRQVAQLLGKPVPGWTSRKDRDAALIESWYYRTVDGAVAAVYFRNGVVFGAELRSNARTIPLGS